VGYLGIFIVFDADRFSRIGTMVKNPPKIADRKAGRATTLILAPLSLLDQWKREIEEKTDLDLDVFIYHGKWDSFRL
jgi:hypothetical protein